MIDDLISRQTTIDAVRYAELGSEFEAIEALPSAQQWIPVSSGELPKSHYWVNVTVLDESEDGKILYASVGWYLSNGIWIVDNMPMYEDDLIRVVAWCELPEPWKGEDK